jgi:NAD-dependent SIR2 family protein deacetylase
MCKETKPISEFNMNGSYHKSYCKECGKIERQDFREWILTFKDKPCTDCGKHYHVSIMDFDHVPERGDKLTKVTTTTNREQALAEIAKCDVVCPTCHRIRTATRAGLLTEEESNVLSKLQTS